MLKSTPLQQPSQGNSDKYKRYREAWARIKEARDEEHENGYYFEAVTLEESIISDRLISYLVSRGAKARNLTKKTFHDLINDWRKQTQKDNQEAATNGTPLDVEVSNLQASVHEWRKLRNQVVHGLVKSSESGDFASFMEEAKRANAEGEQIARAVNA